MVWLPIAAAAAAAIVGGEDVYVRDVLPLLEASCVECHGGPKAAGDRAQGGVDFTAFAGADEARAQPELWALVLELLELEEMPPPGHARPSSGHLAAATPWLREVALAAAPAPQPATLRRLNRREFGATVRDLFGVEAPVAELFADDPVGHGYDTAAGVQSWNSDVLESYLAAAEYVALRVFPADRGEETLGRFGGDAIRAGKDGLRRLTTNSECKLRVDIPVTGLWRIRMGGFGEQAGPDPVRVELFAGEHTSAELPLAAERETPGELEFEARLDAGRQRIGVRFLNDWYRKELKGKEPNDRNLVVQWLEVVGPVGAPEPSALQLDLEARHGSDAAAMLAELASRAWRRPAARPELVPYAELMEGGDLAQVLQLGLTALLASPHFVFVPESRPAGADSAAWAPVDGPALATRLSLLLWSSGPDERLQELGLAGALADPAVLRAEAERLLDDERSRALATGFAMQWLGLTGLPLHRPDRGRFPRFTRSLARSMLGETQRVFLDFLRRDVEVRAFVNADWSFVDGRLAAHYGIDQELAGSDADGFARVDLSGTPRRGLLGHASVLTMTSDPGRTSPVLRGKWILENILGTPPPPPPPGVGSLPEEGPKARGSLRERLEAHRADPSCAVCHAGMDPLGFGLETFDGVGAERKVHPDFPLDVRGELPDGSRFDGPVELVRVLGARPGLARHLAQELLVYGLGRSLSSADRRALDEHFPPDRAGEPAPAVGLRSLLLELVGSRPFTHFPPTTP